MSRLSALANPEGISEGFIGVADHVFFVQEQTNREL